MNNRRSCRRSCVAGVAVLCTVALCCTGADGTTDTAKNADILKVLTAEQKAIRDKYSAAQTVVDAAEKKASTTGNRIEAVAALERRSKVLAEIRSRLGEPIKEWTGVCESVSMSKDTYTANVSFPLTGTTGTPVVFFGQTREDKLVTVLKTLKRGDIVQFSGQTVPKTPGFGLGFNFVCANFLLSEIAPAGPEPAPAAIAIAETEKEAREKKVKSLLNLAKQYANAGNTDEARKYAQKVIKDFPETPEAAEARTILDAKP